MMQITPSYYRIMAGAKSVFAQEFLEGGFIAANWNIDQDLTHDLPDDWREFNHRFIPVYLNALPDKTKISAGLACGMLHTLSKGIKQGDIILTPRGDGHYLVGKVISDYYYVPSGELSHRRKVEWFEQTLPRELMSQELKNSSAAGTVCNLTKYAAELKTLIDGKETVEHLEPDEVVEDPTAFALEKHLEHFLVENWSKTELGATYDIYTEEGQLVGQQYPSDTGPIDILAISKDKKTLLVVELKRGRASDRVVGQIQRYMGYVKDELAEADQQVKGVIIALEDDLRIRRALSVAQNIEFYRYQLSFKLNKS
ncbi:endonuclease NucS [Acinetobacter baumannii]|uniref:endonuclease NucS domain-containing protein n=1 Tax=Acinetobacter baumannii TaxID=470 RepID=UPI00222157C0|nr:endonuclease NucS domain-containing protein [Acinetobacter baumannii]MCW1510462.1 endonuclease NucS [Acinetobacter baumannii]MDA3360213.1 endonuclease NucS [Acinetobacter baumannii]MDR9548201.1 endonuclease NucS [Acinetobacter baumannii]